MHKSLHFKSDPNNILQCQYFLALQAYTGEPLPPGTIYEIYFDKKLFKIAKLIGSVEIPDFELTDIFTLPMFGLFADQANKLLAARYATEIENGAVCIISIFETTKTL